jgi:hypothetical protein
MRMTGFWDQETIIREIHGLRKKNLPLPTAVFDKPIESRKEIPESRLMLFVPAAPAYHNALIFRRDDRIVC